MSCSASKIFVVPIVFSDSFGHVTHPSGSWYSSAISQQIRFGTTNLASHYLPVRLSTGFLFCAVSLSLESPLCLGVTVSSSELDLLRSSVPWWSYVKFVCESWSYIRADNIFVFPEKFASDLRWTRKRASMDRFIRSIDSEEGLGVFRWIVAANGSLTVPLNLISRRSGYDWYLDFNWLCKCFALCTRRDRVFLSSSAPSLKLLKITVCNSIKLRWRLSSDTKHFCNISKKVSKSRALGLISFKNFFSANPQREIYTFSNDLSYYSEGHAIHLCSTKGIRPPLALGDCRISAAVGSGRRW